MPWDVHKDSRCPASKPWGVTKSADGTLEGCHETREHALTQQAALYASEERWSGVDWTPRLVDWNPRFRG